MTPDHYSKSLSSAPAEGGDGSEYEDVLGGGTSAYEPAYGSLYARDLAAAGVQYTDRAEAQSEPNTGPSLPIVLISAACAVAGGVFGLYLSYGLLGLGTVLSAGFTTLGLLFGLGVSGAALTAATGERGTLINMAFSCTLLLLVALFMAMCAVAGAAIATLLVRA